MNKFPIGPTIKVKFNFHFDFDDEDEIENYKVSIIIPQVEEEGIQFSI